MYLLHNASDILLIKTGINDLCCCVKFLKYKDIVLTVNEVVMQSQGIVVKISLKKFRKVLEFAFDKLTNTTPYL